MKFIEELASLTNLYVSNKGSREIQITIMGWNLKKALTIWYKHSIDNIDSHYTWHGHTIARVEISGWVNDEFFETDNLTLEIGQTFMMKLYMAIYSEDEEIAESAREWLDDYIEEDESVSHNFDPKHMRVDIPKLDNKVKIDLVFSMSLPPRMNSGVIRTGVKQDLIDLRSSGYQETDYLELFDEMMHVRYNSSDEMTNSEIRKEWRRNNESLGKGIKRPAQEHLSHSFLKQTNKIVQEHNLPVTCLAIKMFHAL